MTGSLGRRRHWMTALVFALAFVPVASTLTDPGITWDEPEYFGSAQLQVKWVEKLLAEGPGAALNRETIREMWDWHHYWNPHPPVYREGMALTWWATHRWVGHLAGFRLFPALCFAGLVALAFRWGAAAWDEAGGLGAALAIFFMPRLFGHAHLGATETPLLLFWFATAAGTWWAIERERRLGWVVAGAFWGLAAGTKFPGLLALAPAAAWALWRRPRALIRGLPIAAAIAALVFVAANPRMWVDAAAFLETWFWESTHRGDYAPISTYYFGTMYGFDVPWHHVFVMTVAVTPLGILAFAGMGAVLGVRSKTDSLALLAIVSVMFFWALFLLPQAPHHNGVRQFLPMFPFLGLLVGYAVHRTCIALERRGALLVVLLVVVPPAVSMITIHPFHLSYYGEAIGGLRGAEVRGFSTTYWMDVVSEEVTSWMNERLPKNALVMVVGPARTLELARAYGEIRSDLRFTSEPPGDFLLVPMSAWAFTPGVWRVVKSVPPVFTVSRDGVVLVSIYRFR